MTPTNPKKFKSVEYKNDVVFEINIYSTDKKRKIILEQIAVYETFRT